MKKVLILAAAIVLSLSLLYGCAGSRSKEITVISREDGSGTRAAFIELFGLEEKDAEGNKIDRTIETAEVNDSTGIILTSVASNENAIGYISLGALNDSVKAVKIDGAAASVENILSGAYTIARPFNIATKGELTEVTQDFINFILSSDGQNVVESSGYIPLEASGAYAGTKPEGKVVVAGSSSVTPVMEKLKEAYIAVNPNAAIEIQQSDSTTGMNSTIEGICDIGMASRELKSSELEAGLNSAKIAIDGIVVIVNPKNSVQNLSKDQVKGIYTGAITHWTDITG
jgi:phosphate transport system substrate-binding protein